MSSIQIDPSISSKDLFIFEEIDSQLDKFINNPKFHVFAFALGIIAVLGSSALISQGLIGAVVIFSGQLPVAFVFLGVGCLTLILASVCVYQRKKMQEKLASELQANTSLVSSIEDKKIDNSSRLMDKNETLETFIQNAQKKLETKQIVDSPSVEFDAAAAKAMLKECYHYLSDPNMDPSKKPNKLNFDVGSSHIVVCHEDFPQWVFKFIYKMGIETRIYEYERESEIYNNAGKVVQADNLYLIQVPQSSVFCFDEGYVILQEKIDFLHSKLAVTEESIFEWGKEEDGPLSAYFYELYRQLIIFICKTGFSDVKPNNMPLSITGQVGLLDLDSRDSTEGLFRGRAERGTYGLFRYVPLKYYREFIALARQMLQIQNTYRSSYFYSEGSNRCKKSSKKESFMRGYLNFLGNDLKKPIDTNILNFSSDGDEISEEQKLFNLYLAQVLEPRLKKQPLLSYRDRLICFSMEHFEAFANQSGLKDVNTYDFSKRLRAKLNSLKDEGKIFQYSSRHRKILGDYKNVIKIWL